MHKDKKASAASRTRLSAGQRRESILEAATGVFAARGYRAAKMSDVAAKVGVTEPAIFQNFGSKAALFVAVVERAATEARASVDELAAGFGSPSGCWHMCSPGPHPSGRVKPSPITAPGMGPLRTQAPRMACCSPTRRR